MSMKKMISIFIACLSFFIFYLTFSTYSKNELLEISQLDVAYAKQEEMNSITSIISYSGENEENFTGDLITFAKKHGYLITAYNSETSNSLYKTSIYVYSSDNSFYDIPTKNKTVLNYNKDDSRYISTNMKDQNADDIIDFVDKRNNKPYQFITEIHPFWQLSNNIKHQTNLWINLYSKDSQTTMLENLKKSILSQYFTESQIDDSTSDYEIPVESSKGIILKLTIVCLITIILLFICQTLKLRKEIILRKLMGTSVPFITKKLYLRQLLMYFLVYLVIQVLCILYFCGIPKETHVHFIEELLSYALCVLMALTFIYIFMLFFVKSNTNFINLKTSNNLKHITLVNLILKFLILVLLVEPFVLFIKNGRYYVSEFFFMIENKEKITDQLYVSGYYFDSNDISMWEKIKEINSYMDQHGAIYQDFSTYEARIETNEEDIIEPYIIVNKAYLSDYELYDSKNKKIPLDSINHTTVFLSEKYRNKEINIGTYAPIDADVVWIKEGNTFINYRMDQKIRTLKDPIVVYYPRGNELYSFGGNDTYYLPIKNRQVEKDFINFLEKENIKDLVLTTETTNAYDIAFEKNKDELITFLLLLITYIIVILSFIYQNAYIYFLENKQKFALEYLYGNSFLQRHKDLLLNNVIVYIPLSFCLYFFFELKVIEISIFIVLAVVFELLASWVLIRMFEKKRLVSILKGE